MLVYLFELDSVRNSKAEIIKGQQALFEEIVMNGNQVVLSFNQLTDSEAFLSILKNEEAYEEMIGLFRCGALRVSQFGRFRTASQYIQNAIDKCIGKDSDAFLFSGLPVKCTDTELLTKIKDALAFGDLTLLEEIRDKYPVGSTDWKRLEYIQRYIRMILILSMEKLAMNPGKKQIEYSFVDYMKEIITICEKEPDEQLNQGAKLLKEISENLGVDKLRNNRTNWINYLNGLEANESIYIAEAMVDLCYNYTIEESISNVARHFEDREGFRRDLLNRFHQYWEEYCCKIHVFHKGDLEQIADIQVKEPFWDTAVRLVDQNPPMYSGVYETGYNKRKREWKRVRNRKIGKWFATAFLYIVIFCLVEQMMGTIEESFLATTVNIKLNGIVSAILDTLCFGLLGSWVSEKFELVDVLESVKNLGTGIKDIYRIHSAPKQIAYRRDELDGDRKRKQD